MTPEVLANSNRPISAVPDGSLAETFAKVPVTLQVVLGHVRLPLTELLSMQAGSLVHLEQKLGEPVTVIVNGCKVASGHLFVVDDTTAALGVKITEIVSTKDTG